ncbi:peptidylprolyl isomerase [Streptomyces sp. cmx-18-6]|uniref:peptidylprolyl isomerase n=1 Tax=Streptomyces sp. cmx-18-6 TaxID=2790930 RepID=UPI00397ED096
MSSSEQRRRQLAREKFERQQSRREEARRRTTRITAIVVAAVAVTAVAGVSAFVLADKIGDDDKKKNDTAASQSPEPTPSEAQSESKAPEPPMKIDKKAAYTMSLATSQGDLTFSMDAAKTPHTTNSFKALADKGYFDGTKCHRLTMEGTGIFVLQCGDPKGDGSGGPGYNIPDENLDAHGKTDKDGYATFPAGMVAMANTGQPGSGGSQFFMVYKETKLPPTYTPFGTLDDASLKAVQKVAAAGVEGGADQGEPKKAVKIEKATVKKD